MLGVTGRISQIMDSLYRHALKGHLLAKQGVVGHGSMDRKITAYIYRLIHYSGVTDLAIKDESMNER
jgi:hypothetical protein